MNKNIAYRYLRFRSVRYGFIRGTAVARHLRITLTRLTTLDGMPGIGSIGPASEKKLNRHNAIRYAKRNGYAAFFRYTFFDGWRGNLRCVKDRELRKGKWPPKRIHV